MWRGFHGGKRCRVSSARPCDNSKTGSNWPKARVRPSWQFRVESARPDGEALESAAGWRFQGGLGRRARSVHGTGACAARGTERDPKQRKKAARRACERTSEKGAEGMKMGARDDWGGSD